MMESSRRRLLLAGLAATLLAGCGFQLRGPQTMPFQTIYLGMSEYSELNAALRRQIEANGSTKVMAAAAEAEVQLQVLKDSRNKEITSINSAGKVREYELRRSFDFRLTDRGGAERVPPSKIFIKRTLTFNDNDLLAKEGEEALLYQEMDDDLVRQLLRRLAAARPASS